MQRVVDEYHDVLSLIGGLPRNNINLKFMLSTLNRGSDVFNRLRVCYLKKKS